MRYLGKQQGFTLIELIMVIILLAVIAKVSSQMLAQGLTAYLCSEKTTEANWQGQLAIERMVRDFRTVRSANDISLHSSSAFTFVNLNGNTVAYLLNGEDLLLNDNVLASGVNSLTFTYYDKDGNVVSDIANLAYVNVALNLTKNGANYNIDTAVFLRDLSS